MSVQEPDLDFIDPKTGKPFTMDSFTSFARDDLGADMIFCAYISPWLQPPVHR